ncbi:MAG: hypothetical protein AABX53_01885 [Nanoarchaeota archaeon]
MNKKVLFLSILALVNFGVAFSITMAVAARPDTLLSDSPPSSDCNILSYQGPDALNVVFMASKSDSKRYKEHFLAEPPYSEAETRINFYYIDNANIQATCTLYKEIAAFCYSDILLKEAAACPHDAIIVLADYPMEIRSSMYKNVLSINRNHPAEEVLRHELGHLFGLAEEYVGAALPPRQQNCKAECDGFQTTIDGCFEGCSKTSFVRSIDEGVMRTLSTSEYGVYNSELIRIALQKAREKKSKVTGNAIRIDNSCDAQTYTLLEINGAQIPWSILSREEQRGCPSGEISTEYIMVMTSPAGEILAETFFAGNSLFTDAPGTDQIQGEVYTESRFWVEVPSQAQQGTVQITDDSSKIYFFESILSGGNSPCQV